MNQIAKIEDHDANALVSRPDKAEMIRVLQNSLYPGAKPESVELVLSYCRANGIDPMLKSVHIVPMWDRESGSMRDVLMPGIADYRIKAARSGQYAGKSEPVFGPDVTRRVGNVEMTFPQWCKVTVRRFVGGHIVEFTAQEFWLENYAQAKRNDPSPNAMWQKRPYGQLGKCTEGQALRMAFPEFSGGAATAEEMEGKSFEGHTIDGHAEPARKSSPPPQPTRHVEEDIPTLDDEPGGPEYPIVTAKWAKSYPSRDVWIDGWRKLIANCKAANAFDKLGAAMDMNQANFLTVEAFDADAVAQVRGLLFDALGTPAAVPADPVPDFVEAPPVDAEPVTAEDIEAAPPADEPVTQEPDKDREWVARMKGEIAKAGANPGWWREKVPGKVARLAKDRPELLAELDKAEADRVAELVTADVA